MENVKVVSLKRVKTQFRGGQTQISYTLSVKVSPLVSLTTKIDESKYFLALAQKGKNPLTTDEFKMNAPIEFYTGLGKNERPYYMALVPYANYTDKDGAIHVRKQSLFFTSTEMQLATTIGDEVIEFVEKELDSIGEEEVLYNPNEEENK